MKKKVTSLLTVCCLFTTLVFPTTYGAAANVPQDGQAVAQAATQAVLFPDLSGHWAQAAAEKMQQLQLMKGYEDGSFKPSASMSRAEFVTVLYRVFGFTGEANVAFADIDEQDWFYEAMIHANASGIVQGVDATHLSPAAPITRQDAAVMLDRAFQLAANNESDAKLQQFSDVASISNYAKKALSFLVNENVMQGYKGMLQPQAEITRAEVASLLSAMVTDVIHAAGTYEHEEINGNVVIRTADVTLKNVVIHGNLVLAEGVNAGDVVLEDVTVTGKIIVNGKEMTLKLTGGSKVQEVIVLQQATVEATSDSSIQSLTVAAQARGSVISASGTVKQLVVEANNVTVNGEGVEAGLNTSLPKDNTGSPDEENGNSNGGGGSTVQPTPRPTTPPSGEKPVASTTIPDKKWKLVWSDEFSGTAVDTAKWEVVDTGIVYNNELQYYDSDNASIVKDGNRSVLQLQAQKGGKNGELYGKEYSSAKLITKEKGDWTFGKVVVRAKLPIEQGMWPAIWMMPTDEAHYGGWPASGEIDIMELIGGTGKENRIYSTIHFDSKDSSGAHGHLQGTRDLPAGQTFADEYHDFQVEWLPGVIRFYVDGQLHHEVSQWQTKAEGQPEYYTYPAPFDRPFYLILNLAVGGDWPGSPNADFESSSMEVDFVRVYEYTELDQWEDVTGNPPQPQPQREPQQDGNLLYNDSFTGSVAETGVPQYWEYIENAGGEGSVAIVDDTEKGKVAEVTINEVGTEGYSIQLTQMPVYVEKNKQYKVSFDAKASTARQIMSKVTQFDGSWTSYSTDRNFDLTNEWATYEYEFAMRDYSDNNARFEFNMGLNDATVSLANVKLVEVGDAEPLPPLERTELLDGNLIYNGTFDQGKDRFAFWGQKITNDAKAEVRINNFLQFPIMERQLVVDVTETIGDPQSVAIVQPGLQLEENTTYGVYFDAKADATRSMEINIAGDSANPIQVLQGRQAALGSELKNYAGEIYIGAGEAIAEYELQLLFGGETGTAYVDNVRLVKRGAPVSLKAYSHIPAKNAWMMQGLQLENSSEGGKHVAYMSEGDLLQYKVEAEQAGEYIVSARVASGEESSELRYSIKDDEGNTVVQATVALGNTGGWQTYRTLYFPAASLEAERSYYINFEGIDYNTLWVDVASNKVFNSQLAEGLANWDLYSEFVTPVEFATGELVIGVSGLTEHSMWWDAGLQQYDIELVQGKSYMLEFEASASTAKNLFVALSEKGGENTKYFADEIELGTSKQTYSYTFTMNNDTDAAAMLVFGLGYTVAGDVDHAVTIGDVRLYEVNANAEAGGQPQNINLISNGDFSEGKEPWFSYADGGDQSQLVIAVVDGKLQAEIGSAGTEAYHRQVINEGFAIQQGAKYKLSFKAKADKSRKLGIGIGWLSETYDWTGYYGNQVDLTSDEQLFEFEFVAGEDSNNNVRISLDMGNLGGTDDANNMITISEVSLVNIGTGN